MRPAKINFSLRWQGPKIISLNYSPGIPIFKVINIEAGWIHFSIPLSVGHKVDGQRDARKLVFFLPWHIGWG
jgi:hypothetical protein